MAIKIVGAAASNNDDAMDKSDVASAINAAGGTGLTGTAGVLDIDANYRSIAIPFYIAGTLTTGVKAPEFIFPVACTLVDMRFRLSSGTATIRPSKNGGTTDGSTGSVTTSSGNQSQSLAFAAGDRLAVNITVVGSASDLYVTFWANIT